MLPRARSEPVPSPPSFSTSVPGCTPKTLVLRYINPNTRPGSPSHQGISPFATAAKREWRRGEETEEEEERRRKKKELPPELPHADAPYPCNNVAAWHGTPSIAPCTKSPPHQAPRPRALRVSAVVSPRSLSLAPVRFSRR